MITTGKHDSVHTVKIRTFKTRAEAEACVDSHVYNREAKNWVSAEIVLDGEEVEMCRPD